MAMDHAVFLHNHTPKMKNGLAPIEIWTQCKSSHTQLIHAHPWGCPAYVLDATLQDGFKIPKFNPRSRQGIYVGPSPLHASNIGLILNKRTGRISPQFHVIYDDYFETVPCTAEHPPQNWDDFCLESFEKMEIEFNPENFQDDWNTDSHNDQSSSNPPHIIPTSTQAPGTISVPDPPPEPDPDPLSQQREPLSQQREPLSQQREHSTSDSHPPADGSLEQEKSPTDHSPSSPVRRSSRNRKPVERFTFDKSHGYFTIKHLSSQW